MVEISRTTPTLRSSFGGWGSWNKGWFSYHSSKFEFQARELKSRLLSSSPNVDPAATVGTKGVRINAVSSELNGKIDVIESVAQPEIFISRAMSPAIVSSVKMIKAAVVSLVSEQKSKAIGKSGINIRLVDVDWLWTELNEIVKNANTTTSIEDNVDVKKSNDLTDLKSFLRFISPKKDLNLYFNNYNVLNSNIHGLFS